MKMRQAAAGVAMMICLGGAASAYAAEQNELSFRRTAVQSCVLGEGCVTFVKGAVSLSQAIELEPSEAARLNKDASIQLNVADLAIRVGLDQDPNFENGDVSAQFEIPVEPFDDVIGNADIRLDWGSGGVLRIELKFAFSGETDPSVKSAKAIRDKAGLQVIVVDNAGEILSFERSVNGDAKRQIVETSTAEGNEALKAIETFRSRISPAAQE